MNQFNRFFEKIRLIDQMIMRLVHESYIVRTAKRSIGQKYHITKKLG